MNERMFLAECQRYLAAVKEQNPKVVDVGLHGREATWSLDTDQQDALGSKQPLLVGRYTVPHLPKKEKEEEQEENQDESESEDEEEEEEEDEFVAKKMTSNNQNEKNKKRKTNRKNNNNTSPLQITLYISFCQPYSVPALDFVACELETSRSIRDIRELKKRWLPQLLDAIEIDVANAAAFEETLLSSSSSASASSASGTTSTTTTRSASSASMSLLTAASAPRVSMQIHEVLNVPVFNIHACDTVKHLQMMMAMSSSSQGGFRQSPIDIVISYYAKFVGLR